MENSSFRDILRRFLEETKEFAPLEPAPAAKIREAKAKLAEAIPLLQWEVPALKVARKDGYPPPVKTAKPRAPKQNSTPTPEILFKFTQLLPTDQSDVQLLIVLGADFRDGVSVPRLKKAHRALVKKLHPDQLDKSLSPSQRDLAQEKFLILQAAYERLSRSLTHYKQPAQAA